MHIVYVVNDISHVVGGVRVILEHANRLAKRGHLVELWVDNNLSLPYFECTVPVKAFDKKQLDVPDIVVLTDQAFLPVAAEPTWDKTIDSLESAFAAR